VSIKEKSDKIILGIDPGTVVLGYGLIQIIGNKPSMITMGVVKLQKFADPYQKLGLIFSRIDSIIEEFKPHEVALEAPFYGKNVQSMLKLGRAQGIAMAPAINRGIPVHEYAPRKIKQSITGNGSASKEQVATMLSKILHIKEQHEFLDATDGLAAALCHFYQSGQLSTGDSYKNWNEFIRKNPGRIK
jgi:crossover junction endodeoxyribonuclease RuvC